MRWFVTWIRQYDWQWSKTFKKHFLGSHACGKFDIVVSFKSLYAIYDEQIETSRVRCLYNLCTWSNLFSKWENNDRISKEKRGKYRYGGIPYFILLYFKRVFTCVYIYVYGATRNMKREMYIWLKEKRWSRENDKEK